MKRDVRAKAPGRGAWWLTGLAALLIACSGGKQDEKAESDSGAWGAGKSDEDGEKKEEAVPVEVVELATGEMEAVLRFSTHLEAEKAVKVLSVASRRVTELMVEEGDRVRSGQALLRLEDDEQTTELARVEAELAKAKREHQRNASLHEQGLIADQVVQDLAYERERLELLVADSRRRVQDTIVRAPITGTITNRMIQVGDHVNTNQHLFDMADFGSLVARVYVPEKDLHRLRVGQSARALAQATDLDSFDGRVKRIAPLVDATTGTVKVTVGLPQDDLLRPGMFMEVELVTERHEDALMLPKRALVHDRELVHVFRVKEDRVEKIAVEALLDDGDHVLPAEGLAAGDRIVIAGQAGLKDGSLVRVLGDEPEEKEEESEDELSDLGAEQVAQRLPGRG